MRPDIKQTVGGWTFTWEADEIVINVSRVKVHSTGRVTGEIVIRTTKADYTPILYPTSEMNFSAPRTRKENTRILTEKYPDWAWDDILTQLCHHMLEQARAGEPMRRLNTNEDVTPPEYILEPLLFKGLPTILFGPKAVCKSTLAMVVYATLTIPWKDNLLGLEVKRITNCVYLDWEVDSSVALWSAQQLRRGMGLPHFDLFYRRMTLPLAQDIDQVYSYLDDIAAECVIVDSLGPAVGGDLMKPADALMFNQALRQLKCSALIIGQTSKDREEKNKSVYGSTYFEYFARNLFEVRKAQEEGEDSIDIGLFNTYSNLARRCRPLGFQISFNGTGTHIERQDVRTIEEFIERLGIKERIKIALKKGPTSYENLAKYLDNVKRVSLDSALSKLKRGGIIDKKDDKWSLV